MPDFEDHMLDLSSESLQKFLETDGRTRAEQMKAQAHTLPGDEVTRKKILEASIEGNRLTVALVRTLQGENAVEPLSERAAISGIMGFLVMVVINCETTRFLNGIMKCLRETTDFLHNNSPVLQTALILREFTRGVKRKLDGQ